MTAMPVIITRIKDDAHKRRTKNIPRSLSATIYYIDNAQEHGDKLLLIDGRPVQGAIGILADGKRVAQRDEIASHHALYRGRGRKLNHFIISYGKASHSEFTHKNIYYDVKALMRHMGMEEHACMYAAHSNTDNIHVHVVIDRVSLDVDRHGKYYIPVDVGTVRLKNKEGLVRRVDALCQQAAMYDICLQRSYDTQGIVVDNTGKSVCAPKYGKIAERSFQEELRTGEKSIQTRIQDAANAVFHKHDSWEAALQALNKVGIAYELAYFKSGEPRGAVLVGPNHVRLKNSALHLENTYKKLVERFGEFPLRFQQNVTKLEKITPKITEKHAKRILVGIFQKAVEDVVGWSALEAMLKAHPQSFCLLPSGGSFVVTYNGGADKIKLSDLDRKYSKQKLDVIFAPSLTEEELLPVPTFVQSTAKKRKFATSSQGKKVNEATPEAVQIPEVLSPIASVRKGTRRRLVRKRKKAIECPRHHGNILRPTHGHISGEGLAPESTEGTQHDEQDFTFMPS